jgi:hypothetical protein
LFANPSSFEAFPNFYLTNSVTLSNDRYCYAKYGIADGVLPEDSYVILDNRNMTLTNSGRHLADKHNSYGDNIFIDIEHNRQLSIASGRPELYKAFYISATLKDGTTLGKPDIITYKFRLNDKPIYNRYAPFFMHFFEDDFTKDVNKYDVDSYNSKIYFQSMYNINASAASNSDKYVHKYKTLLLDSPSVYYEKDEGIWYMYVSYYVEKSSDLVKDVVLPKIENPTETESVRLAYASNDLLPRNNDSNNEKYIYIGICDYEAYNLETIGDFSIGTQCRDVI